jgi:hypothetical protein
MNFDFNPKMDKMLGDIKEIGKLKQKEKVKKIVSFSMSP